MAVRGRRYQVGETLVLREVVDRDAAGLALMSRHRREYRIPDPYGDSVIVWWIFLALSKIH